MGKIELHHSVEGAGDAFIWAHGLMLNMDFDRRVGWLDWSRISQHASLVRYDARGHGRSPSADMPEAYRWDRLAEDMLSLADAVEARKFIAGGQSMGCATSLFTALFAPERVKALVLVTPPTAWDSRSSQAASYRKMADRLEKKGVEAMAQLVRLSPPMPEWMSAAHPEQAILAEDMVRRFEAKALAHVLLGAGQSNLPDPERLKPLRMPTLILAWQGDRGHPLDVAQRLNEALPESRLELAQTPRDVAGWTEKICDFLRQL